MSKENYINKIKDLPESLRQFIGLISITLIVILSFSILNGIFGQGDDLVKRMKLQEERIAEEKSKCFAGFTVSGNNVGVDESITISGEALSFLSTGIDTRVYFIKNF